MPSNIALFEKYNSNKYFIETGSYAGDGIRNAIFSGYKDIRSVELSEKYYKFCKDYFKYIDNVSLYFGISSDLLNLMMDDVSSKATIWLDAHFSGGDSAGDGTPLMSELDCISTHPINYHTIIIDDLRMFSIKDCGFDLDNLKNRLLDINTNYLFRVEDGYQELDVLVADVDILPPINIIVFSKDRAAQLDLFIRSFREFVVDADRYSISVLYTYSSSRYKDGYNKIISKAYDNISFIEEESFKNDLIRCLDGGNEHTVFFVDDDVFTRRFHFYDKDMLTFRRDRDILCRSLRLHRNLSFCYPARKDMNPPLFFGDGSFHWLGKQGDYGYPMSLDGHIFRTNEILPYIKNLVYTNPNSLEGAMAAAHVAIPKMICGDKAYIINNPVNKVQTNNPNFHGDVSADYLNDSYLDGKVISLSNFIDIDSPSCHKEIEIILEDGCVCN